MHCVVGCVTVTLGGVLRNDGHNYLENDGWCSLWYVVYLPILCSVQDISCILKSQFAYKFSAVQRFGL